jgi:hypothetical protein
MNDTDTMPGQTTRTAFPFPYERDGWASIRIGAWFRAGIIGAGMLAVGVLLLLRGNPGEALVALVLTIGGAIIAYFGWRNVKSIFNSVDTPVAQAGSIRAIAGRSIGSAGLQPRSTANVAG